MGPSEPQLTTPDDASCRSTNAAVEAAIAEAERAANPGRVPRTPGPVDPSSGAADDETGGPAAGAPPTQ